MRIWVIFADCSHLIDCTNVIQSAAMFLGQGIPVALGTPSISTCNSRTRVAVWRQWTNPIDDRCKAINAVLQLLIIIRSRGEGKTSLASTFLRERQLEVKFVAATVDWINIRCANAFALASRHRHRRDYLLVPVFLVAAEFNDRGHCFVLVRRFSPGRWIVHALWVWNRTRGLNRTGTLIVACYLLKPVFPLSLVALGVGRVIEDAFDLDIRRHIGCNWCGAPFDISAYKDCSIVLKSILDYVWSVARKGWRSVDFVCNLWYERVAFNSC